MFYASLLISSIIIFIVSYYFTNKLLTKKKLNSRLHLDKKKIKSNKIKEARKLVKTSTGNQSGSFINKLKNKLSMSGLNIEATSFISLFLIILILLLLISVFVFNSTLMALAVLIAVPLLANMLLNYLRNIRLKKIEAQLLEMTLTLISNLKSGYSLVQGLNMVVEEGVEPLAGEIDIFLKNISIGMSYEEAADRLMERNPIENLKILMSGILINKETGGSLSYVLDNITETIREKERINGEVKSLTAQGRLSGLILSLMPVGIAVLLYVINPDYMKPLFTHPLGKIMLGLGMAGEITGVLIIRKITRIDW